MSEPDVGGLAITPKRVAFWLSLIALGTFGFNLITSWNAIGFAQAADHGSIIQLQEKDQKIIDWFKETRDAQKIENEKAAARDEKMTEAINTLALSVKGLEVEVRQLRNAQ